MKKMIIFEPAMCCSTGVCGPSVDQELIRVSTNITSLKRHGIMVERNNLSSNPQIFVLNKDVHQLLNSDGIKVLPITMVDGVVVKTNTYPTEEEFCNLLGLPENILKNKNLKLKPRSCRCNDGCC
ncbi:MAG: arsD [Haloplasmataceae bacterium]|nr:arsD [Haloplasmataceae bacterium]